MSVPDRRRGDRRAWKAAVFAGVILADPAAHATATRVRSEVDGIAFMRAAVLPNSPEHAALDPYCDGYRAKTLTARGRQVAAGGWIVTSEAPLGAYRVVTFASGFTPGTSAMCFARNANIAVYEGPRLIALAYGQRKAHAQLGEVERLEGGALLVWGGDGPAPPLAELQSRPDGLVLAPLSPLQSVCRGRATVPNIYGKPIDMARRVLAAHGWKPQRPTETPGDGDLAAAFARRGVMEADACAGSGVGYCMFRYRSSAGILSVTTTGEGSGPTDNRVVAYEVNCTATRPAAHPS